ncbi:AMIN domain-containing protein [Ancylothrix sp. C2]|uniref:AMIN domain-containing protein n=1 Tax=Ancylothrix sp. D3o TaxID=2953691 RepID=UPI0021BBA0DB|nr:AMIN domain-containing protein [Ancylothrix sp. D3o]MCT7952292.1 AMIN domain-containing protein [Ancylothrix sp. D3o]
MAGRYLFSGLVGLLMLQMPVLAQPAGSVASTWKFDPVTGVFAINVQQGTPVNYYTLSQPARVVLEVGNTILGGNPIRQSYSTGSVRGIQVSQIQGGKIRIILELAEAVVDPNQVIIQQEPALVTGGAFLDRWVVRGLSPQVAQTTTTEVATPMPEARAAVGQNAIPSVASLPVRPIQGIGVPMPEVFTPVVPAVPVAVPIAEEIPAPPPSLPSLELPAESWTPPQTPMVTVPPPVEMGSLNGVPMVPPPSLPSLDFNINQPAELFVRKGTELKLRYTGTRFVELEENFERQEVLVLDEALRDGAGNVIASAGTPVIGRFETNNRGSKFVAQAITLGGRNVPLEAASSRLREVFRLEPGLVVTVRLNEDFR